MKGLIILEGPDGTGKTTLAKELCKRFNGRYLHMTYRFKKGQWTYHLAMMMHAVSKCQEQLVVLDRCWMSEAIYADYFRGGSDVPHLGRFIDRIARRYCATYVMCLPQDLSQYQEDFKKLVEERPEMYTDAKDMANIAAMYEMLWGTTYGPGAHVPTILSGYHQDIITGGGMSTRDDTLPFVWQEDLTLDGICSKIRRLTLIRMKKVFDLGLNPLSGGPNWLGYLPDAKYLFIGDKTNTRRKPYGRHSFPFMEYGNESLFFAEALSKLGVNEVDCCYVNANEDRGLELLHHALAWKSDILPIFLGTKAAEHAIIRQGKAKLINDLAHLYKHFRDAGTLEAQLKEALA